MKKLFAALLLLPSFASAWMGAGGSPDYSRDAGNSYYCASTATIPLATQAGVSVTSPTISLYNPFGSGKNLVLLETSYLFTAAPAASAGVFLAYNINIATPTGINAGTGATGYLTAAIVGKSTSTATTTSIAKCNVYGTLSQTPVPFRYLGGTTGAAAIGGVNLTDQTQGKVVIAPGQMVSMQTTSASLLLAHFLYREEPL